MIGMSCFFILLILTEEGREGVFFFFLSLNASGGYCSCGQQLVICISCFCIKDYDRQLYQIIV